MLVAVAIGVPLYSNAAGIMPLVEALYDKGLPMGTLLAFMMAVVALSLPELILLRRVLKPPLLAAARRVRRRHRHRHRDHRLPVQPHPRVSPEIPTPERTLLVIIKVLGPGCTNCKNLERVTRQAVDALGVDATIEKVTDYPTIVGYGVMATPALVVDEKLVLSGRVPTAAQVRQLLTPLAV